jgi:putative ABC transport system permease protein
LQLVARDPQGFPQSKLALVRRAPGVLAAAPLLEAQANVKGPRGSRSVLLVGADESLARLNGALVRHNESLSPFGHIGAVVLPHPLAREIGVTAFGQEATFQVAGRSTRAPLYAQLGRRQIGALTATPVAVMPLAFALEMTATGARVSRILVQPQAGAEARARSSLLALGGGRLDVEPVSHDEVLFAKAAAASSQSTQLFAAVSALVGFLFAFNAMLFTVPQRRRLVLDLRREGYSPRTIFAALLLDALALGFAACAIGLALGEELSIHIFHTNPAFLSLAFSFGSQRVVGWQSVALACGGGLLAASAAVLIPLRSTIFRGRAVARSERSGGTRSGMPAGRLALAGLGCLIAASALLLSTPRLATFGMVLIVAALLFELPLALVLTLAGVKRAAGAVPGAVAHVAAMELGAARGRALAITATGALAVFGSVAVHGAHDDLLAGLERAAHETNASADVWVAPAGSYDLFQTAPFKANEQAALARLPGVHAVRVYRGGLLDYGDRRVLVMAPPADASPLLAAGQLQQGSLREASARVRAGGWVVLSRALAEEHHLQIGGRVTLPTPNPQSFRVAALSTNVGWAPGAMLLNASDYARAWDSADASAYGIELDHGVPAADGVRTVERALGPDSGLVAETAAHRIAQQVALSRQALVRLTQIATMILIAAVLAMTAAMGAMVWQRRPRLAKLKLDGLSRGTLWRTILLESLLLLGVGCATGAVFGLYGRQLADRALAEAVNFPIVYSTSVPGVLSTLGLVVLAALGILAIPSYLAARAPATLALQD